MSWQERKRVEEELSRREALLAQHREEGRRLLAEDQAKGERAWRELLPILDHFRARQLLERIKTEVWQCDGEINFYTGGYSYSLGGKKGEIWAKYVLESHYPVPEHRGSQYVSYNDPSMSPGSYGPETPRGRYKDLGYGIGSATTTLAIEALHQADNQVFNEKKGYYLEVKDSAVSLWRELPGANYFNRE